MYLLYSALLGGFFVAALPYYIVRALGTGRYLPTLKERLGFLPSELCDRRSSIWIHAVSVGEVIAARTLVPLLKENFPEERLVVSVTTVTGRKVAEHQLTEVDAIFYCPFDFATMVRRAVRFVRPRALLLMETEIWPHLLRECHRAGATTLFVNGRISDRSFPRYRAVRWFLKHCFAVVDRFCMQDDAYAERIQDLGAPPERVHVTGSLKFDQTEPDPELAAKLEAILPSGRTVLVCGSTLDPEETILLDLFGQLRSKFKDLYLILAPRQPDRFDEVFELARKKGYRVVRRSDLKAAPENTDVLVFNTLGELAALYAASDIVFVGGSLVAWGGHNVIEPAAVGKPVVFGPHMSNFREIAAVFTDADAAKQVGNSNELLSLLEQLLASPKERAELGLRAARVVEGSRGAAGRTIAIIKEAINNQ